MQVNFYATFRLHAGVKSIQLDLPEGSTARQAVDAIVRQIPALRNDWLREDGELHAHVHGFLNDRDIATLPAAWETPVQVTDTLDFLPPVAGGSDRYQDGTYLEKNPTWHVEDSAWKASQVMKMVRRHPDMPLERVVEVGCGAGEVLALLQKQLPAVKLLWGFEVSPQGFALCKSKANAVLRFYNRDLLKEKTLQADLLLALDVIEHIADMGGFLAALRGKAKHHLFHIPLELNVQTVWREQPLLLSREKSGHLHFFTKNMALQVLRDHGYEVVDWFYTPAGVEQGTGIKSRLAAFPRRLAFAFHRDSAVRLLGGYSLLVLTS